MLFLAYIVALVVGAVIGMFGGGGSLLVVAIIYMAQTPRPIGLSTAYISILVGVTALIGLIPRIKQKQVNWPTVLALGVPVTLGMVIVRAWLIDLVPDVVCQFGSYHLSKKTLVLLIVATLLVLSFSTITAATVFWFSDWDGARILRRGRRSTDRTTASSLIRYRDEDGRWNKFGDHHFKVDRWILCGRRSATLQTRDSDRMGFFA